MILSMILKMGKMGETYESVFLLVSIIPNVGELSLVSNLWYW